ncbi:MAG: Enoyl-CoA hydratase/carnithine racemase [Bryobacterales bacterium]|jgi:methylglutaconyl-CoA hydratase|nr:Enoyl-CoA hydratase/carnithine racemase [Bryobacterales bacterium]
MLIEYVASAGVARITLNRPEKRNALTEELISALRESLQRAADDSNVRVLLIRGAGKDFCAGLDLSEVLKSGEDVPATLASARRLGELYIAMRRHPKPIVAAVQGRALGGGAGIATASDLIIANESAQFGYPEVNLGFIPAIVTTMLRRAVNERQAMELVLTGEPVSAARAYAIGLVNRVYPDAEFEAGVEHYIATLAEKSATAMSLSKTLLYQTDGMSFEASIEAGAQANVQARMTDDFKRGVERFLKRT